MNSKKQRGGSCAARKSLKGGSAAKKSLKGGNPAKKTLKGGSTRTPEPTHHRGGASKGRQLYCFKCKTKVAAKNVSEMSKKTKTRTVKMAKGVCPKCGGNVYGIVGGGH